MTEATKKLAIDTCANLAYDLDVIAKSYDDYLNSTPEERKRQDAVLEADPHKYDEFWRQQLGILRNSVENLRILQAAVESET